MADYIVKLVDHTDSPDSLKQLIQQHLQTFFDQVLAGTPDTATVQWGAGLPSDRIVLHFVQDVPSSYIVQQMPGGTTLLPELAGHTRTRHITRTQAVTGSEFYKFVLVH